MRKKRNKMTAEERAKWDAHINARIQQLREAATKIESELAAQKRPPA